MESALNVSEAGSLFAEMISGEPAEPEAKPEIVDEPEVQPGTPAEKGDDAEQSEPDSEVSEEQPQKFTIKLDGKDIEVTLDELKNGYQRQADYTRKTMEVSESRKAADAEMQKAQQERQQFVQKLEQQQIILANALQEQSQTNWEELLEKDPVEFLKQKHLFDQRQAAFHKAQQEASTIQQQFQAEQKANAAKFEAEQQEKLLAKLPDWKDAAKAKAGKAEIVDFLLKEFTPEEVATVSDHRLVLMARKAMLYDKVMSQAKAAAKKVENVPQKVLRPGNGANQSIDKRSSAFQQLSKTGSLEDAGRLFASIL